MAQPPQLLTELAPYYRVDVQPLLTAKTGQQLAARETRPGADVEQIGRFGIGFKSVYAHTQSRAIHCGDEHFEITDYVYPHPVAAVAPPRWWTTLQVFPFDRKGTSAEQAVLQIATRLAELSPRANADHRRGRDRFDPGLEVDGVEFAVQHPTPKRSLVLWSLLSESGVPLRGAIEPSSRQDYSNATVTPNLVARRPATCDQSVAPTVAASGGHQLSSRRTI